MRAPPVPPGDAVCVCANAGIDQKTAAGPAITVDRIRAPRPTLFRSETTVLHPSSTPASVRNLAPRCRGSGPLPPPFGKAVAEATLLLVIGPIDTRSSLQQCLLSASASVRPVLSWLCHLISNAPCFPDLTIAQHGSAFNDPPIEAPCQPSFSRQEVERCDNVIDFLRERERQRPMAHHRQIAELALRRCEQTFRQSDWKGFRYWVTIYWRERPTARKTTGSVSV